MDDVERFAARVRALFHDALAEDAGVLHLTAVWEAPDGCWRSIRVGPAAPHSELDAFVLALGRARADAIVTSGAILRAEPELCHEHFTRVPGAAAWRAERLDRSETPMSVVLTRRADLDLAHPLFLQATRPVLVVTNSTAASAIRERARAQGLSERIEVVDRDSAAQSDGLRGVVQWLKDERDCRTVTVETGVSTSRALYDEPVVVDELLLSVYSASSLPVEATGEIFLEAADPRRARFAREAQSPGGAERAGAWRFERHRSLRSAR